MSVILLKMTGAALCAELPQLVLKLLLTASCFPTLGVYLCMSGYSQYVKHILMAMVVISVALTLVVVAAVLLAVAISMGSTLFFVVCFLVAGLHLFEDEGRRNQAKELIQQMKAQLVLFADKHGPTIMKLMMDNPAETSATLTWCVCSSSSAIVLRLTGAALHAELPRLVLKILLSGSFLLSLGVWFYVAYVMYSKQEAKKEEKLVSDPMGRMKTSPAVMASMPSITQLKEFKPSSHISSRTVKTTALSAAGGAITLGTGGGVVGLTSGGAIGAACGVLPAFFTFGLSIPVGAAIGGSLGWATGVTVGGTAGAISGGAAGLTYSRLVPEKTAS